MVAKLTGQARVYFILCATRGARWSHKVGAVSLSCTQINARCAQHSRSMSSASLARPGVSAAPLRASAARRTPRGVCTVTRAVDADTITNNAVFNPTVVSHADSESPEVGSLKRRLLAVAAASGRGLDATAAQKSIAATLIANLILVNATPDPASCDLTNGDWELVYSDTFLFRSSPFFWSAGAMMGENASFFYAAHDHQVGMFGGGIGRVVQSIDMANGRITSDCIVKASLGVPLIGFAPIFAGYGSVITSASATIESPTRISCTTETTTIRQDDTIVIPFLNFMNNTSVPVEDVMRLATGGAAPTVFLEINFVDREMRISKLEDGSVFVYQRC